MLVRQLMSRHPYYCTLQQRASDAAREMWTHDIGCVPVVDDARVPVGVVTDRDLCLRAYLRNVRLEELRIDEAMSREVHCCGASDTVAHAEQLMRAFHVRRLPVVDCDGKLIGVLSLDDVVIGAARSWHARLREQLLGHAQETLAAVATRTAPLRRPAQCPPRSSPSSRPPRGLS